MVAVVALLGGWLYARSDAPSAARLLLGDDVVTEPLAESGPGPDPDQPTSGPQRGRPTCGVLDAEPPAEEQVEALAAGVVMVRHRPDLDAAGLEEVRHLVAVHHKVLVAPVEDLDAEVVATAWRHRYEQAALNPTDLERFIVGWGGRGPDSQPCP